MLFILCFLNPAQVETNYSVEIVLRIQLISVCMFQTPLETICFMSVQTQRVNTVSFTHSCLLLYLYCFHVYDQVTSSKKKKKKCLLKSLL